MTDLTTTRIALPTGVELDVTHGGPEGADAIFFLHGFPESHRTWRHQLPELAQTHRVFAPDQRGYARSSKPSAVSDYTPDKPIADLIALAGHFGIARFTLVGHDWGGAIAWGAALAHPDRVERLIIVNAPHPLVFQRSLIDDANQRAASQYIRAFRDPGIEKHVEAMGFAAFFDTTFARHLNGVEVAAEDRAAYIDEWSQPGAFTAMLNWYRAAPIIVPATGEQVDRPAYLDAPFPVLKMPVLVIWGMQDNALLPCQLDGLDALIDDLSVVRVDSGHFVPWQAPGAVTDAIRGFLAQNPHKP